MMYALKTKNGYDLMEAASALQKSIRRNNEDTAMYFAVELFDSNYDEYLWKRLRIITSEDVGLAEPAMPAAIQALYQSYIDQKKKKDEKNRPERLFLVHAVLLLCRAKKSRLVDWTLISCWNNHDQDKRDIPEYALDKHTVRGRAMKRGFEHFFDEGTKLANHEQQPMEADRKEKARTLLIPCENPPLILDK